jgi:hypothetical protein
MYPIAIGTALFKERIEKIFKKLILTPRAVDTFF